MILAPALLIATLDANALYGMPLRDTLLRAAEKGLYRPTWSYEIWDEVLRHLKDPTERERPLTDADATRLLSAVERSFPGSFVSGYERFIPIMTNDPKDRHIVAAAVHARAQVVVTYNLRHFSEPSLTPYGIEAQHPDGFLTGLYDLAPGTMAHVIREQAADLKKRPTSPQQVLDKLEQVGIARFARVIRAYLEEETARGH